MELPAMDMGGVSDPYVKVRSHQEKSRVYTPYILAEIPSFLSVFMSAYLLTSDTVLATL